VVFVDLAQLSKYIPQIERTIARSYSVERRRALPPFRPSIDVLSEFTLRGGKRFRALLVLAGYHLATNRPPTPVLGAAAALEHFQSWMLIHDDIIDHAEQRRGGPAVHRTLAAQHTAEGGLGDPDEHGVGLAITLGDLEEPFTIEALLASSLPADRRLRAAAEYARMARLTAYGQLLDIRNEGRPVPSVTEADVLLVHRLKSAIYTVAAPLRIGATLGGGSAGLLDELERFGEEIGVAFQLRDDVLGAGFDAAQMGKSANDLIEGKRTLLVVRAWSDGDDAGRRALELVLGRKAASAEEVEAARTVIRSTGSLEYSEKRIAELSGRAYRRVDRSRYLSKPGKALLHEVGERLVHRSS
jgi:geranylgeranyl diphosphate synthase type I